MGTFSDLNVLEDNDKLSVTKDYFEWLCNRVEGEDFSTRRYFMLLWFMFRKDFYWTVPNDDNREADGLHLRELFLSEVKIKKSCIDVFEGPPSCLEVLIALAERMNNDLIEGLDNVPKTSLIFFNFISNLELDDQYDGSPSWNLVKITSHLDFWLDRKFCKDGSKWNIFKVRKRNVDLRKIEIWDQAAFWQIENFPA